MQQRLRMQVAVLLQGLEGLKEVCPGVRSCLIEYEPRTLSLISLLDAVKAADAKLRPVRSGI